MAKTQNLSNRPDYVAHLPKTDHNLSHDFSFTSSTGHILPLDYQLMNVGERITYTPHIYARSNPLLTAAMLDVDVHIDTFFVPAQMLFTAWDAVRWQINDPISSFWSSKFGGASVDMPLIDIEACIGNSATGAAITDYWSDYLARFTGLESFTSLSRFTMFDCVAKEQFRLLNHFRLALGSAFVLSSQTPYFVNSNPRAFYMYLLAYQACFENYFRLDDWEKKNVRSYNIDKAYTTDGNYITSNPWILRMNYRPWKLDYFTKNMNNPISSFRNMLGNSTTVTPANLLSSLDNYLSVSPNAQPKILDDSNGSPTSALTISQYGLPSQSGNSYVSTASIRSLFAVEKLNRIIGRTAKDYDSQVLAHFGFKVPHDVKHQLTHLSHSHGLLHVGEVIATADTQSASGGSALGSIAGKGYIIMKGKTTKFTAPTDGVFISLWSAVPRVRYIDTVDKSNFITSRLSLFIPEFDKLGAQPIYQYETDQAYMSLTGRYGWQRRYAQYKEKPNVATLAFVIPRSTTSVVNQYSSFVASRRIYGGAGAGFYADYYCPPTALNSNMVVQYDTAWSSDYETKPWLIYQQDPFVVDYHSDFYLVSAMTNWSEPDLD